MSDNVRNMSESLQGCRTMSNANTLVIKSYYILYDKENRCVLKTDVLVPGAWNVVVVVE